MIEVKRAIHRWILDHDDSWAFIVSYITLAVVLSLWISLFWLVVVVAVHALLEWVRQREVDRDPLGITARILWELKLDIALIAFALALGVYMELFLGMVGLSAAGRAGVQTAGRFAAWQKVLRGALLSVDDAAQVARMVAAKASGTNGSVDADDMDLMSGPSLDGDAAALEASPSKWGGWNRPWNRWARLQIGFGLICVLLILAGPFLTDNSPGEVLTILAEELHPWPSRAED
jgi:hypothetical protein